MQPLPTIHLASLVHLVFLCLWGGVVATEAVLELYPYRRQVLHEHSIRYHYWIDLLVELPLLLAVLITGIALSVLARPLSSKHVLLILFALVAVAANVACIALVVRRKVLLERGAADTELWRISRRILTCAGVGMPFAALASAFGFWLAYHRMVALFH